MSRERVALLVASALAASLVWVASAQAAFPGQNGKIVFVNSTANGDAIFTVDPDGSGLAQLTSNPAGDREPGWSADGARIVFTRDFSGQPPGRSQVWTMNADGSGLARFTGGDFDCDPAFLPDGRVVFVRSASFCPSGGDIWIHNLDGSEVNLTATAGIEEFNPTSSPDGTRIAFARGADAIVDTVIHTMPSGGGAPTPLTDDHAGNPNCSGDQCLDSNPNYSPDGATIAFDRCSGGEGCFSFLSIYRVPAGGGTVTRVTTNSGGDNDDCQPAYAPDGTTILFTRMISAFSGTTSNCLPSNASAVDLWFVGSDTTVPTVPFAATPPQGFRPGFAGDWQPLKKSTESCYGRTATIIGTDEDDKIVGTPGDDVIKGHKGDDVIKGKRGDDVLCGQRGDDRLFGGRGDDILIGGKDSDFLKGGAGKDQVFGGTPDAKDNPQVKDICVFGEDDKTNNCKRPG